MFTGIVTHVGRIERAERAPGGAVRLVIAPERPFSGLCLGGSVAVNGVCLTLVDLAAGRLAFDVVPETLRRTTLDACHPGQRVNLEGALRVGDELGGHWVQGHVDGTAQLLAIEHAGSDVCLKLRLPAAPRIDVIPKGSITLDGVSLTVGSTWLDAQGATCLGVYLIPHTLAVTTLGERRVDDRLNVEADVLGRWIQQMLSSGDRERWAGPRAGSPRPDRQG